MRGALFVGVVVLSACGPEGSPDAPGVPVAQYRAGLTMSGAGGCDTSIASGLDGQLIEELNCVQANLLVDFRGSNVHLYSGVTPWMEASAKVDLKRATDAKNDFITISSAYRTLGAQYLLYRWWKAGGCGIQVAAVPGSSNHQSGRAIDTPNYSYWKTALTNAGWTWLGSSDVVHFDHLSSPNVASKSTLAFQRLWNKNHSTGKLVEDGVWGPNTESAMASSPTSGFPVHGCATTGVVNGTITDAMGGAALAGVTVTAGGQSTTTAADGSFSFTLGAGAVTVTARKSGYLDASVTRTVSLGGSVSASMTMTAVQTTGLVHGTVTSQGAPVEGAAVSVGGAMTSSDASGVFEVTVPAGAVTVTVTSAGFETATQQVTVTAGATSTVAVVLVPTSVDQPPVLAIEYPPTGQAYDASQVTVRGSAADDQGPVTSITLTVDDGAPVEVPVVGGAFEVTLQLGAGENVVTLAATDGAGQAASLRWTGTFRAGFSGWVHRFDDEAAVIVDAELTLFDVTTGAQTGTTRTDPDGRYELVASEVGLQRLHVEKDGYTPRDVLFEVSAEQRGMLRVALTPGDERSIRFIEPTSEGPFETDELTISGVVNGLEVSTVTVNGTPATLVGSGFVVKLPLPEGKTTFTAVAEDGAGVSVAASVVVLRPMRAVQGGCASAPVMPLLGLMLSLLLRRRRH